MPLRLSPSLVGAVLCGALLLSGCDSHTPDPVSSLPTFQEGTVYQYRYSTTTRPLEDPDQAPRSQASTVTVRVARTGVSLDSLDGLPPRLAQNLVEVQSSKASAPDDVETQWYVSSPDSTVEVAYRNAGAPPTVTAATGATPKRLRPSF